MIATLKVADVVVVALIVGVFGLLNLSLSGRQRRREKREDWARQDAVMAAAKSAVDHAAAMGQANLDANERTAEALEEVHGLLNSEKTAGMNRTLLAERAQLLLMRQVAELKAQAGLVVTDEDRGQLVAVEHHIDELAKAIAERDREAVVLAAKALRPR